MTKIALVVERSRAYGRRFCEGVADYAQTKGDWSLEFIDDAGRNLSRYDGFIFRVMDDRTVRRLKRIGKPVVDVFYRKDTGFGVADPDNAAIARLAAEHFLSRRFDHFAFCGYNGVRFSDARRDAFTEILAGRGFPCDVYDTPSSAMENFSRDVIRDERVESIADRAELSAWLRRLPRPCAVFCCHDLRAYHVAKTCRAAGLRVPDDIAVLGVDDDTLLCTFLTPMLSSVDPNAFAVGQEAARIMDRMISDPSAADNPPSVFVRPKGVVTRASTETYPVNPPWISKALVFIRRNVRMRISASDVFSHLGLSHALVERAFRKTLKSTVQSEIVRSRLEEAERLLTTTELTVVRVAELSGFSSAQYFCRNFIRARGMSPQQYREEKCSKT